jgi:preprotein translocase subunit SecA
VQRELNFAIVDEVDSILIDEARTPLIISGQAEESTDLYLRSTSSRRCSSARKAASTRTRSRATTRSTKAHQVHLTEAGHEHVEQMVVRMGLLPRARACTTRPTSAHASPLNAALRAHALYQRDVEYVVQNGEVVIVDEFTGRTDAGPALVRRPAPGGRGQGRRAIQPRTRPSPRSPSRTTSACTASSPA